MPKWRAQHNKTQPELALNTGFFAVHKPRSLGDVLHSASLPRLRHLASRARAAATLREMIRAALPDSLAAHVTHAQERQQELTLWIDSSAFCARLRFEAPKICSALSKALGRPVTRVRVRVQPRQ
jgi:hypothetical protein